MKRLIVVLLALVTCCSAQVITGVRHRKVVSGGGGTFARVGSNFSCTSTGTTSSTCTFGSTPATGELIVFTVGGSAIGANATATVTDQGGNALTPVILQPCAACQNNGTSFGLIFYEIAPAGLANGNFVVTVSNLGAANAVGARYTKSGTPPVLDQAAAIYSGGNSTTCPGSGAAITSTATGLVIGACVEFYGNTPNTMASSGSWTDVGQQVYVPGGNGELTFMQDQVNVAAGSYQPQATVSWNGAAYVAVTASFK